MNSLSRSNELLIDSEIDSLANHSARTVLSADSQFRELKQTVCDWFANDPPDRGYCTPKEDEAIGRLLVSYWQIRNALLETVMELRDRWYADRNLPAEHFLTGYAGGLLLLDAGRFLRESFHERPTLRRKLNEPEPAFGIPEGVYDTTQHSLTSGRRLWQLFDAARHYHQNQAAWSDFPPGSIHRSMCEIIDGLASRLEMRFSDYAEARIRFRMRQFWSLIRRNLWASSMFRLQKLAGTLAADRYLKIGHQPGIPQSIRMALEERLKPGDILLVRKEYALTNYFLPGYWPHTALYVGTMSDLMDMRSEPNIANCWSRIVEPGARDGLRVIEAMKDGVHVRELTSPLRSDSVLVLRPNLCPESIKQAISRAFFHVGKEYDFSFDFTVANRLVCTEVIYRALDGLEGIEFPLKWRAGRLTIAAEDFVQMALEGNKLSIATSFIPRVSPRLLDSDETRAAIPTLMALGSVT